ncbi:hypothetical protein DID74_02490 [Candidatus Marinamargulisbacteria bacterium SCGC AG-333-B06]|nr:hypothetical protein DID74_02490 [Candidatus Marinamargulisbacteria bacterium SCGC AG-333-B06]
MDKHKIISLGLIIQCSTLIIAFKYFSYPLGVILLIINSIILMAYLSILIKNKVKIIILLTSINISVGTLGFYMLSGFKASFVDSLYMTIITLSTIGFTEVIIVEDMSLLRWFTIYLTIVGLGNLLVVLSSLANYLTAGKIQELLERRERMSYIKKFSNHIIICGGGITAEHIISEFLNRKRDFVLIEKNKERCNYFAETYKNMIVIHGDATEDTILVEAGINKAAVLVAILPHDKDNLFLTISTKHLNHNCRIISKTLNLENKAKLVRAGATSVIPNRYISALRIVSEVVSPNVVTFLDTMMRTGTHRVVEIIVKETSQYCGDTLNVLMKSNEIEETIISFKYQSDTTFQYNPKGSDKIKANMSLFYIMDPKNKMITENLINR